MLNSKTIPIVGIFALALGLRLLGLGAFLTVDETNWILRSGDFYRAVFIDHDPGATFLTTHPGTTLTWLVGPSLAWQEHRLGAPLTEETIQHFIKAARLPVVLIVSILITVASWLTMRRFDIFTGALTGLLIAAEPYLVGMGQVAHLDMLLGLFMLISMLLWWEALSSKQWPWVVAASVVAGLALSTKMLPALWLGVFSTALSGFSLMQKQITAVWLLSRAVVVISMVLVIFVALWPAVLTQDDLQTGYLSRDAQTIITDEHTPLLNEDGQAISIYSFYARTVLGRMSLVILIPITIALVMLITNKISPRKDIIWLLVYTVGFLVIITFVAKKADRYAVPALLCLPIIASWLVANVPWKGAHTSRTFVAAVVTILLITTTIGWAPYAIAHNNPLFKNIRPLPQQGWGEGLDAAARWLNQNPLGDNLYIASWYPSVTRAFFKGTTLSLSSRDDYRVAYIVAYRNMGGRAGDSQASNVLDELKGQQPVHTVNIGGLPYVQIYETLSVGNFTKHVGEVTAEVEVGQTIIPDEPTMTAVEIGFATFSSRANTHDVILQVYDSPAKRTLLRTATVNAADIVDNEWQRFGFEPIEDAAGREFYVSITSPTSGSGNAVTVRYIDEDIKLGEMYLGRPGGELTPKPGDIAYRLP